MKRAIFLDRDGVINRDSSYVYKWEDFHIYPDAIDLMKKATRLGYIIIIVTNQSGIARGFYSVKDFKKLMEKFLDFLSTINISNVEYEYCPHHPDGKIKEFKSYCSCRKPGIGMFMSAQKKYGIDLSQSIMIGDKMSDMLAGYNAGVENLYLITRGELTTVSVTYRVNQIKELRHIRL